MNLIPCSEDCLYQADGCCTLETPAQVTGNLAHGCVHYVSNSSKKAAELSPAAHSNEASISAAPQTLHESS
ncbi:MAG: hypothetical protein PUC59_05010 [Firmicutes bacterium]|nr:hypothetical protein [Bacillota bacterium]